MARIGKHEDVGEALRRLVADELAAARTDLVTDELSAQARIHKVRQRLKRVRAILRVQRPALGAKAAVAKRALSGAARQLARARDADVAAASARTLQAAAPAANDLGLDRVVAVLDRQAKAAHAAVTPLGAVFDRLTKVEADLAAHANGTDGADLLRRALKRAYRSGRKAMKRAETSLATPDLHRWRKSVKDLAYLIDFARKRLPGKARGMAKQLETLGDVLGLDHDHALLAEKLALAPDHDPALMRQLALIASKRRGLETRAFTLGHAVYRDRPAGFARRMALKG